MTAMTCQSTPQGTGARPISGELSTVTALGISADDPRGLQSVIPRIAKPITHSKAGELHRQVVLRQFVETRQGHSQDFKKPEERGRTSGPG